MPLQQTDWDVEFKVEDPPQSISFIVEGEMLLGRTPNGQDALPSIDLTPFNAVEWGVSRRHGVLTNDGTALSYYDLNSENGSVLNDKPLSGREPVRVTSGDTLYLGHLRGTILLRAHPRKTTILAVKENLQIGNASAHGRGQRVLVVEDDQGLAEMYRLALERSGFMVQNAREMVTAIRALNHQMPSAILLDLMLPGIRGLELARYVRRDTESPNVPIIVVSALRDKETVNSAMQAGADVFMGKPVDWKELTHVIGTLVAKSEGGGVSSQTKKLGGTARLEAIPTEMRHDTLVAFIDSFREPLTLMVQPTITLGRQNPGALARSHVDLESYEAYGKGVSRVHATIRRSGELFEVEDLGSANGTFINGTPLTPNHPSTLKNGDELRLGNMRLRLYFLSETEIPRR